MHKIVAVLSIVGSLIAVASFLFDVQRRPISRQSRATRGGLAVLLALLATASWFVVPPQGAPSAAATTATVAPLQPERIIVVKAPRDPVPAEPSKAAAAAAPPPLWAKPRTRLSAITWRGATDDELTMQVRDALDGRPFSGSLEQNCTRDDSLEGLVTCEQTLRLRIGDEAAFSVDARGGGFTDRAAERHGRELLAKRLAQKLTGWKEGRS